MENNVRPHLELLSGEQILQVHHYALRILSETGMRIDSPSMVSLLERRLGLTAVDRTIRFPAAVVEEAIQSAPRTIEIFDRSGQPAFTLGADRLRFGVGVTALFYQEPVHDHLEPFTRRHFQDLVRLGSSLPLYDVISTVGIVHDVPESRSDLYGSLELIANTTKPLVLLVSDENQFPAVLDLYETLHGDLAERPFVLPYFNPVTPFIMNAGTVDKMQLAIERGLPVIFANYGIAGASTPLTPAGILSLMLAELLAGLTISQAIRKGASIVLGMLPVYFDMRAMLNFYDPQSVLISMACAQLMAHYGIPHCSTSGSGTGWGMDLIAADTYWMNTLALLLSGASLAPFVGDSLGSKSISPCTLVHVHEIIDQALRLAGGLALDDAQAGLEEISSVRPGGSFLTSPSTRSHYKSGYYFSRVYPRYTLAQWQAAGEPSARQVLRQKTRDLLVSAPAPDDHDELIAKGEELIRLQP
jgi:trimethylamine--corrinoid protein Co-methyltransferase